MHNNGTVEKREIAEVLQAEYLDAYREWVSRARQDHWQLQVERAMFRRVMDSVARSARGIGVDISTPR
jgi:hypothetical protein